MKKRLKNVLGKILSTEDLIFIPNSYDIVGNLAILSLNYGSHKYIDLIAKTIMEIHKNVKTILLQNSPVSGKYRVRDLKVIAGENKTKTFHKENGCIFYIDIMKSYFSPRLIYERMRIPKYVQDQEIILNMFAGVGCFSIVLAKYSNAKKIYSIDINPHAVADMHLNVKLNRVYDTVVPILGDAKEVIEKKIYGVADRVLMPLPEKALEYLPYAILALKKNGGFIHYYDFIYAKKSEDPIEKVKLKLNNTLINFNYDYVFSRIVRSIGPNWYQIVIDISVKK